MSYCNWLDIPFNVEYEDLLKALAFGHRHAAAQNQNVSSVTVQLGAQAVVPFESSVASAILTMGGLHAPIAAARQVIFYGDLGKIEEMLGSEEKIPGWGNSFYKTSIDPAFSSLDHLLRTEHREIRDLLDRIGDLIFKATGKMLYPNAAAFTAAVAEILDMQRGTEGLLAIAMRLPVWGRLYFSRVKE